MKESPILREIWLACGALPECRLFRNNVAMAWVGEHRRLANGDVLLRNARPLHAGLHTGSGDLIGWTTRNGVAVFTSLEVKSDTGRASDAQRHWAASVAGGGGIAGIVRSPEEALALVTGRTLL